MPLIHGSSPERILDYLTDIWLAFKGIGRELERWNSRPVRGRIYIAGVQSVTTADMTNIPDNDVPAKVDWVDRLGGTIAHDQTTTTWSAEDAQGQPSAAVSVVPGADDESAIVQFKSSQGVFRVVATVDGANGQIRAESGLYNITPGAPSVGTINVESK